MQLSTMMLAATLTMFGTQNMSAASDNYLTIQGGVIVAIHDSDVPADLLAQEGGVLESIAVKVGDHVKKNDILAKIDDQQEQLSLDAAKEQLDAARKEADNDVNVRYAKAGAEVHKYRYEMVQDAIKKVADAYTLSEQMTYFLTWKQFALQTEQAEHELDLAQSSVRVNEAKYRLAEHQVARRQIKAPVDGVIEEVKRVEGDWVRAGDPIVRLVQMDRLRINASLQYNPLTPADVRGKPVIVTAPLADSIVRRLEAKGITPEFPGEVIATGSVYGRGQFDVVIEVENRTLPGTNDWLLMPGMTATIKVKVDDL